MENVSYLQGQYGALTVDQSGDWKYVLANNQPNVQALAQGETVTDSFQVQVTDEHGASATQSINVTVTGQNDAPVIASGSTSGAVQEDGVLQATGTLTATDVDHGAVLTWNTLGGNAGHVTQYHVTIDEFKIQQTIGGVSTTIFDDPFTGTNPPTSPAGSSVWPALADEPIHQCERSRRDGRRARHDRVQHSRSVAGFYRPADRQHR